MQKEELIERLLRLDEDASLIYDNDDRFHLVIVGGGALLLTEKISRATHDIDALDASREIRGLLERYDINCQVQTYINNFPYNYDTRLKRLPIGGKENVLLKAEKDERRKAEYQRFFAQYRPALANKALNANDMPEDFQKVWKSYQYQLCRPEYDNETKRLMRRKILQLQMQKGVSNYRLYTDLHLNPGNINAWLKHDDSSKLSLDTARSVLQYLETK